MRRYNAYLINKATFKFKCPSEIGFIFVESVLNMESTLYNVFTLLK